MGFYEFIGVERGVGRGVDCLGDGGGGCHYYYKCWCKRCSSGKYYTLPTPTGGHNHQTTPTNIGVFERLKLEYVTSSRWLKTTKNVPSVLVGADR
jgi:hypothetical protein